MNSTRWEKPPRWWSPKLSPAWIRFWRPFRRRHRLRKQRLLEVEVRGAEHVRQALGQGHGVLITPNHASHADCFALYEAADQVGVPFYVMVAWQVLHYGGWLKRLILRHHGCFSVDREGTDFNALRKAREVLESEPYPLAIFPEGEVYHINERVTPFREGPAAVALLAARKGDRPVVCIPCAMRFRYLDDPTPKLLEVMSKLEEALYWRPRPDLTLGQRIYHFAEGVLALKEIEFMGATYSGSVPERIANLIEFLLGRIEARHGKDPCGATVPERVKALRREAIKQLEEHPDDGPARRNALEDLDDLFLVVQAFSYPGDYVAERPTIERIAETLDKFEEDVLPAETAAIRGSRRVTVTFGEPIPVPAERGRKASAAALTDLVEEQVQALLDDDPESGSQPAAEAQAG
jgi:1-acyl-sn-glycerol-3-phosphate acyltransferase